MAFIGRMIDPPKWVDDRALAARKQLEAVKKRAGYPVLPIDPDHIHSK